MHYRICHISTVHFPNDDRIFYKECISLEMLGYDVFFIVKNPEKDVIRNVKFISLPDYKSRIFRIIRGSQKAYHAAKKIDAEVYHFHDPELIVTGLKLKKLRKKVIYDVHENVSDQLDSKAWLGPFVKLIRRIYLVFEQRAVKKFDVIISATGTIENYFKTKYPLYKHKFRLLRNYSILSLIDKAEPVNFEDRKVKLIYLGGLSKIRGIKEIISAFKFMEIPPLLILFGNWESDAYRAECEALAGWKNVRYMGYKKLEEIYPYLKASDIGIALLYPEKNYLRSLPVKAFEYMACGKPMMLSNFPYWKEIFGNCAIFVDPLDSKDIAKNLTELISNKKMRKYLGDAGRKSIEEHYSWETEAMNLADIYSKLLGHENQITK